MPQLKLLEICIDGIDNALTAASAGADRLEVNSALCLGGLTPSYMLVKQIIAETSLPLIAMIRPRSGYFTYSAREFLLMQKEAEALLALGVQGIAFGFITDSGTIDYERVSSMVKLAGDKETVFHRAFDLLPQPLENSAILAELGVTRILTSGCEASAWEGRTVIRELVAKCGKDIEILPAGGIKPSNASLFLYYTQADQLHSSGSRRISADYEYSGEISFITGDLSDAWTSGIDILKLKKLSSLKVKE
ncbi:MAG: copper homeostasis protein CutC [Candidatus Cloacimonetes bacterium]|nr:copper homeostasis protein CutC [Candidatus Cloacimonadota bacterium]